MLLNPHTRQRWAFLTHGQRRWSSLTHDDNPLIHNSNALTHDENPLIHDGNALTHDNAVHLSLTTTLLISHSRQHNALCASLLRRRPTFIIVSFNSCSILVLCPLILCLLMEAPHNFTHYVSSPS